ncbi:MAG: DMT family transporter [Chryseobacterium sp.]|nr:MAG: DMT family transporter [Chryseobacterium sp.]
MRRFKGILYIALGASSYGVLATFVRVANSEGAHNSILNFSQFVFGVLFLLLFMLVQRKRTPQPAPRTSKNSLGKLLLFGTTLGMTSIFYYLSVQYIPVSVGIVMLMQSVWMSIVVEAVRTPKAITPIKILGGLSVIFGSVLASNVVYAELQLDWRGIALGMLAAMSFTTSMFASNSVALELPNSRRSLYLVIGGLVATILFWNLRIVEHFDLYLFVKWGLFLSFFGTFLPPLLFTKGFPITGTALGGIVSSMELPVSVLCAHWVLSEAVAPVQWVGIGVMLLSVALINLKPRKKTAVDPGSTSN